MKEQDTGEIDALRQRVEALTSALKIAKDAMEERGNYSGTFKSRYCYVWEEEDNYVKNVLEGGKKHDRH